ncbi:MAG TPA: hypothetical protein VFU47_06685, partial [Armatimonadota bacterium]|nr:hypothetical protein [Armatimonadota bacterium]
MRQRSVARAITAGVALAGAAAVSWVLPGGGARAISGVAPAAASAGPLQAVSPQLFARSLALGQGFGTGRGFGFGQGGTGILGGGVQGGALGTGSGLGSGFRGGGLPGGGFPGGGFPGGGFPGGGFQGGFRGGSGGGGGALPGSSGGFEGASGGGALFGMAPGQTARLTAFCTDLFADAPNASTRFTGGEASRVAMPDGRVVSLGEALQGGLLTLRGQNDSLNPFRSQALELQLRNVSRVPLRVLIRPATTVTPAGQAEQRLP